MRSAAMRAVRWHGRGDVRVEEVPAAPLPAPDEVRIRVSWCGLCGTDVNEYRSGPHYIPVDPHPVTGRAAPIVLGHEISGRVDAVGAAVAGLREGDLVALNALLPCGACDCCARGQFQLCATLGHLGFSADGGLAELVTAPAPMVVAAPPGMRDDLAALAEPFAVAVRAVRHAGNPTGTRCIVVGAGSIGLAAAIVLAARGNEVTLLDVAEARIRHATAMGFTATGPDATRTGGLSAPVVVECAGAPTAADTALGVVEPGGVVVLVGLPETPSTVDLGRLVMREVRVVGSASHLADTDMVPALGLLHAHAELAGQVVTSRIPLPATVTHGLDALVGTDRADHAKILVQVGDRG